MRRETLDDIKRKRQGEFCGEARVWLRRKTMREAWATCTNGAWMAWWLFRYAPVRATTGELLSVRTANGGGDALYSACGATPEDVARWADVLRATYNVSGTRRKQS